jgi:hypothetical protein
MPPLTLEKERLRRTYYAGAVRIQLVSQKAGARETHLTLVATAEPRVQNFSLDPNTRHELLAIDDQGHRLQVGGSRKWEKLPANPPGRWMPMSNRLMSTVRRSEFHLQLGEKEPKSLKEVKGNLPATALTPSEPLIVVDNVLAATGKSVKGAHGGLIQVQAIDKTESGDYQVKMRLENLPGPPGPMMMAAGGQMQLRQIQLQQIRIQMGMRNMGGKVAFELGSSMGHRAPTLVDKTGKAYRLVSTPSMRMDFNNGQLSYEATLVFRAEYGQGPPDRLVYSGQRSVNFHVPFRFTDVPLP